MPQLDAIESSPNARPAARAAPAILNPHPLRKPVNTLAIIPKNEKITPLARKAWNLLLYEAQEQGLDQEVFRIPLDRVVRGIDFGSNDHKIVKDHLRSMVSTTVEWQSPTVGEATAWNVCGLLAHAKLSKVRNQVWVEWSYAVNLRQELLQPSVFARLSLPIMSQLRTHAGLVLYEICTRYKDVGRTSRQPWQWWWPVLTGRPAHELTDKIEYRIFKRDTLRTAIAEAAAITDFEPELVEYRKGRFISEIQFLIHRKSQKPLALQFPPEPIDLSLLERARVMGIEPAQSENFCEEYGKAAFAAGLSALEKRLATAFPEPLRNPYRYLKSILPNYVEPGGLSNGPQPSSTGSAPAPEETQSSTERLQRWTSEWLRERQEHIATEIQALPPEHQASLTQDLVADMETRGAHPALRQRLLTKGWQHPIVRHEMVAFFARGAYGEDWNKPTSVNLLEMAARGAPAS